MFVSNSVKMNTDIVFSLDCSLDGTSLPMAHAYHIDSSDCVNCEIRDEPRTTVHTFI